MTVTANGYEILDYWPDQWKELTGREARAAYNALMEAVPGRIQSLANILERNGLGQPSTDALQPINDWLILHVEADESGIWPSALWRSIARDIGLYVGQAAMEGRPHLQWQLVTSGPTMLDYRNHVISGFSKGSPRVRISPSAGVFRYATRILNSGRPSVNIINDRLVVLDSPELEHDFIPNLFAAIVDRA